MNDEQKPNLLETGVPGSGYWNPYLAGLLLGATLLASLLILGAGLGASAAPARFGAWLEQAVAPDHTCQSAYFGPWCADGQNPLTYYLVFMFAGTFLGGLFSAILARRVQVGDRTRAGVRHRLPAVAGAGRRMPGGLRQPAWPTAAPPGKP